MSTMTVYPQKVYLDQPVYYKKEYQVVVYVLT